MKANLNQFAILGAIFNGQGSVIGKGCLAASLRDFSARGLSLCLIGWRVLKRLSTGTTPAMAMCPTHTSAHRRQRHERWMPGVVVDPGTVGDC